MLLGFSLFSVTLQSWFATAPSDTPTIGGFLYLTVASLAAGMTVTAVRWATLDHLHAWTGLPPPALDFSKLSGKVDAFALLIEIHYRHYLFYSNMAVASAIAFACYRVRFGILSMPGWPDLAFFTLEAIFITTSRDTLRKYHRRGEQLLGLCK